MIYLIAILAYLAILTCIGLYKSRQVRTQDDFAVAGRTLSPWVMVCTMLAAWIGTGSIVGNAEQAYQTGAAALVIPLGTFFGMIVLAIIAPKARGFEASSVPQIIGIRYGQTARMAAVAALVIAYMVIVSYQFNAGGAVLEVIAGQKDPIQLSPGKTISRQDLLRGRMIFQAPQTGSGSFSFVLAGTSGLVRHTIHLVDQVPDRPQDQPDCSYVRPGDLVRIEWRPQDLPDPQYTVQDVPSSGLLQLQIPRLDKQTATIIAAVFITAYTVSAGLMGLASTDILTGSIILICTIIAFPALLVKAGGFEGMRAAYAAMPGRANHMKLWGGYGPIDLVNYLLPTFLLIMGDANQYQRIFASRSSKGARQAVTAMVFAALAVELLIIASAWVAGSMTPDPANGRYILIYAARHHMPFILGISFMITVVGIIVSTADAFLLVPAVTLIKDIYCSKIDPNAGQKKVLLASRLTVLVLALVAYGVSLLFAQSTGFFKKALYAYTVYGAAITPCLVAAMFWPRATASGAIASIVTGTVVTLVWSGFIKRLLPDPLAQLDAVLPAITCSVVALIGVSLTTSRKLGDVRARGL